MSVCFGIQRIVPDKNEKNNSYRSHGCELREEQQRERRGERNGRDQRNYFFRRYSKKKKQNEMLVISSSRSSSAFTACMHRGTHRTVFFCVSSRMQLQCISFAMGDRGAYTRVVYIFGAEFFFLSNATVFVAVVGI